MAARSHFEPAASEQVEALLEQLTVAEKAALTAGSGPWRTTAIPRLGIGAIKLTDGANAARGDSFLDQTATCFPSGSTLGAGWDPELVRRIARVLAEECVLKGAHALLGPTLNLHRYALGGRNFESYGEDPWLASRLGVEFIRGLQERGVAATAKHLVANDCEIERESVDVIVDEVTLREVYLRPFEAAVVEAGAWMVMSAYNKINGIHASEHREMLTDLVKHEWGFNGVLVSDWGGTHDTVAPACAGLDLEMPGPPTHFGPSLAAAVERGDVPVDELDDKVRRILGLAIRTGALHGEVSAEESPAPGAHADLAREAAVAGTVLLKNEGDLLPLQPERLSSVAVIGPNAADTQVQGGGSAKVTPPYRVSVLDGLRSALRDRVRIDHAPGTSIARFAPVLGRSDICTPDGEPGALVEYFRRDADGDLDLIRTQVVDSVDLTWIGAPLPEVPMAETFIRCRFRYLAQRAGDHRFGVVAAGRATVTINGEVLLDSSHATGGGPHFFGRGSAEVEAPLFMTAEDNYDVVVSLETRAEKSATAGVILGVHSPATEDPVGEAVALAAAADVAVVVVGTSGQWEMEGGDRPTMELPGDQAELVRAVVARNPMTVVVVNAGSAVDLSFADNVPALLYSGFGGQEVGNAVADVLVGASDPGGRLPFSIAADADDVLDIHYRGSGGSGWGGGGGSLTYVEGMDIGYRHHLRQHRVARYAFGHGLSYAEFDHSDFRTSFDDQSGLQAECLVRNTSSRSGSTVTQIYVTAPGQVRRLCGFAKTTLAPGAQTRIEFEMDQRSLMRWSPDQHAWIPRSGEHLVELALSASDEALGWTSIDVPE